MLVSFFVLFLSPSCRTVAQDNRILASIRKSPAGALLTCPEARGGTPDARKQKSKGRRANGTLIFRILPKREQPQSAVLFADGERSTAGCREDDRVGAVDEGERTDDSGQQRASG